MRVAYVSQFADVVGGGEHSLMELISHLPDSIQPELVVPAAGALSRWAEGQGIPVHLLPMPKIGFATVSVLWRWRQWLRQEAFDIVHANQSRAAFYAGCAASTSRVIFHCRIAERDGLMDSMLMRLTDAVICNSKAVAHRFGGFSAPLRVIYNGVTIPEQTDGGIAVPDEARLLLFVGRLSREKQPQLALQLFEQLASKYDNLHLALLGGDDPHDPAFSESVRTAAAASAFRSRIHMPGAVAAVSAWYRRAELLLLTSSHEGFGRVLVEAMASGVVPVAFAVGGVPEIFEDGVHGFLVASGHPGEMRQRVESLLQDNSLRLKMAGKGRERASRFSVDAHADAVVGFYREVLNRG